MKLIFNNQNEDHSSLISDLINRSKKIMICSGHFKKNVLNLILNPLKEAIKRKVRIEIISNHQDTEAKVIKEVSRQIPEISLFLTSKGSKYLHSKVYYFEHEDSYTAIIGSANLTKGALSTNEELSVMVEGELNSKEHAEIINYFKRLNSQFICKKTKQVPFKDLL
jgi:HKD family nuclease